MDKTRFIIFSALFAALGALHCIWGIDSDSMLFASVTKILPLLLLTVLVCRYGFRPLVLAALVLSMLGDVAAEIYPLGGFRMPSQIAFFAAAQVCYALEFLKFRPLRSGGRALGVLPFMMGVYGALEVFTLICASMQRRSHKWCFVLGASVFLLSDALILVRTLAGGFAFASLLVMTTYYLAQYFLNVALLRGKDGDAQFVQCRP